MIIIAFKRRVVVGRVDMRGKSRPGNDIGHRLSLFDWLLPNRVLYAGTTTMMNPLACRSLLLQPGKFQATRFAGSG